VADIVGPEKRSAMMSGIRGRDTRPELKVRSILHSLGYRFRLHAANLPGKPDIVLPKLKTVILVHGCFWHRHKGCRFCYSPKTRIDFWEKKFVRNQERDREVRRRLRSLGWRTIVVWECKTRDPAKLEKLLRAALN